MFDMKLLAEEIADIVREQVALAVAPLAAENKALVERLAVLEEQRAAAPSIETMIAEAVAALAAPKNGTSVTPEDLLPTITEAVRAAVAQLPPARDGKDADPDEIKAMVAEAVAALPVAKDGTSVTADDVRPIVADLVNDAVALLPRPRDGKDADPEQVKAAVELAVAALPAPKDGTSITVADVEPVIEQVVARAVAALPAPKDGVGLAGALIDRTGALKMTLSDGTLADLGRVEGKNGDPGFGFEDMNVVYDGERSFSLEFAREDEVKSFTFALPMMIDRGVYRAGHAYQKGDCVTFGGSLWIAQADTDGKPDSGDKGWRLGVKRGRDGRDLEPK